MGLGVGVGRRWRGGRVGGRVGGADDFGHVVGEASLNVWERVLLLPFLRKLVPPKKRRERGGYFFLENKAE